MRNKFPEPMRTPSTWKEMLTEDRNFYPAPDHVAPDASSGRSGENSLAIVAVKRRFAPMGQTRRPPLRVQRKFSLCTFVSLVVNASF